MLGDVAVGADADIERLPSGLATRLLVQWWFRPAGRSAILRGAASIRVAPAV
jgi:hypothetical protein